MPISRQDSSYIDLNQKDWENQQRDLPLSNSKQVPPPEEEKKESVLNILVTHKKAAGAERKRLSQAEGELSASEFGSNVKGTEKKEEV